MATFTPARDDLLATVADVMEKYHNELHAADVTIDVLMAFGTRTETGDLVSPALTEKGWPCRAKIRKTPLKDRAKGCGDAELLIDGDEISTWNQRQLESLISHELSHLELKHDKETGYAKTDDLGRPVLNICLHDYQLGGFHNVAHRWGDDSFEVADMQSIFTSERTRQLYFHWYRDSAA